MWQKKSRKFLICFTMHLTPNKPIRDQFLKNEEFIRISYWTRNTTEVLCFKPEEPLSFFPLNVAIRHNQLRGNQKGNSAKN